MPCRNGGSCGNTYGSYMCKCTIGFTGTNCELGMFHAVYLDKNTLVPLNSKAIPMMYNVRTKGTPVRNL